MEDEEDEEDEDVGDERGGGTTAAAGGGTSCAPFYSIGTPSVAAAARVRSVIAVSQQIQH